MNKEIRAEIKEQLKEIAPKRRNHKELMKAFNRDFSTGGISYWDWYKKCLKQWNPTLHCTRDKARYTMLAYGFLKGLSYKDMEQTCTEEASAYEIARIAKAEQDVVSSWLEEVSDVA